MIRFTMGNLLEADVEAVVNTVNTVGVMGKGIALMFKERYPEIFKEYSVACKRGEIQVGSMFVTETGELSGPRWVIHFPTKKHWRAPTQLEWVEDGLRDLRDVIVRNEIRSIALPPLGCGNGGLEWSVVRSIVESALADLDTVDIVVYEPTSKYQNVSKKKGVEKLTPARALIAEMVRRYSIVGFECSILEIQKLAWFLERVITRQNLENPLDLDFAADRYGPYAYKLTHLLDALDGSYLHCDKRLADASPSDAIRFNDAKRLMIEAYFTSSEGAPYREAVIETDRLIDGFQTPLGMEVLATVDWLLCKENAEPSVSGIRTALAHWPGGSVAAERKQRVFSDRLIKAATARLSPSAAQ